MKAGVNQDRGRWAIVLGGDVAIRCPQLSRARRRARIVGGIVRRWRRMPDAVARGWETP